MVPTPEGYVSADDISEVLSRQKRIGDLLVASGKVSSAVVERTVEVFGMPKVAIELGAATRAVPLPRMADVIREHEVRHHAAGSYT